MYIANGMGVNELTSIFELCYNLSRRAAYNFGIGQRVSRTHFTQSMGSTLEESDMQRKEWDRFYELTSFE